MRKLLFLFILLVPFVCVCTVWASDDVVNLEHPINDDYYAAGRIVNVRESVDGDLMTAAESISSTGIVRGDILAAGRLIDIKGDVGGDIRAAGQNINVNAKINRSATVLGQSLNIASDASVGKNLIFAGERLELTGEVKDNARAWVDTAIVSGNIGGDLIVEANQLKLLPGAMVNGDIQVKGANPPEISEEAEVKGEVKFTQVSGVEEPVSTGQVIWGELLSLIKLLGLALLLASLAAPFLRVEMEVLQNKPWASLGAGLGWLFMGPVLIILLAVIIIGQQVAGVLSVSYIGLFIIALILFKPLAGALLGKWVLSRFSGSREYSLVWAVLLGTTLLWLVSLVPVVGFLITVVGAAFVLGSWLVLIARYGFSLPNRGSGV